MPSRGLVGLPEPVAVKYQTVAERTWSKTLKPPAKYLGGRIPGLGLHLPVRCRHRG